MNHLRILVVCAGFGLMSFLSIGCPYDGPHYPTTYGVPTSTPTPAPLTASVTIANGVLAFNPLAVTILHGGSVTFLNNDASITHSVLPDNGSGTCATNNPLAPLSSVVLTFPTVATISYHCAIHNACGLGSCSGCSGTMVGTVVVQ